MTEHDLTRRYWGHDILSMNDPQPDGTRRVCVFLPARISKGDTIKVKGANSTGVYEVVSDVDRPMDPGDQHFMTVRRIG